MSVGELLVLGVLGYTLIGAALVFVTWRSNLRSRMALREWRIADAGAKPALTPSVAVQKAAFEARQEAKRVRLARLAGREGSE